LEPAARAIPPEELADLIPNLATKEELNEWERENNLQARAWAIEDRTSPADISSDEYVRKLHKKMFDQTWKRAGE
jgi:fido (protein-threonine AMPylation protein)